MTPANPRTGRDFARGKGIRLFGQAAGRNVKRPEADIRRNKARNRRRAHLLSGGYLRRRVPRPTLPLLYSTYERGSEIEVSDKPKVLLILGGGPNRIGQGIEFDYCCCHASFALRDAGITAIMVNSNPETVSTDYDTSDRLYFEPLTFEDVMNIVEKKSH